MTSVIQAALQRALKQQQGAADHPPPDRPARRRRMATTAPAPSTTSTTVVTLEQAREELRTMLDTYTSTPNPTHKLLVVVPPGVGKTHAAVQLAERLASQGRRVLYCGPRHEFFNDIRAISGQLGMVPPEVFDQWWYEWRGRTLGDPETGDGQTCRHAPHIEQWMTRGYEAMDFCRKICGWDYIKKGCPYHLQKETRQPIIFAQREHLVLGHPLMEQFHVIIGDETPINAFQRRWSIPTRHIVPEGMPYEEPLTEILYKLRDLAESGGEFEGPKLLEFLGGAQAVKDACDVFDMDLTAQAVIPHIRRAEDVDDLPFFHLPHLSDLLGREAEWALAGQEYISRVMTQRGRLHLLLRHTLGELPKHIIWLDATANEHMYKRVTGWELQTVRPNVALRGRIFQVWDTANTKGSLIAEGETTPKVSRVRAQIDQIVKTYGYTRPVVIGPKDLAATFDDYDFTYFYGSRGTNRYEECDAVFIVGTPQPPLESMLLTARMLFQERMRPWDTGWCERPERFNYVDENGQGWQIPAPGYWGDDDLEAVLWQEREAEIIQAAHRVRPVVRAKDIWLLLSLPIWELPLTKLLTVRDVFQAPRGVDPYLWPLVIDMARDYCAKRPPQPDAPAGYVTAADIAEGLQCVRDTSNRYIDMLIDALPDEFIKYEPKTGGRGRPPKAAARRTS